MKIGGLTYGLTYTRLVKMGYSNKTKDVQWFYPRIVSADVKICCPACGHIIGGRMKWDYPPIASIQMSGDMEGQTLYIGQVLAECPDCVAYFVQQEVTSYDESTVESYISKSRPAKSGQE